MCAYLRSKVYNNIYKSKLLISNKNLVLNFNKNYRKSLQPRGYNLNKNIKLLIT